MLAGRGRVREKWEWQQRRSQVSNEGELWSLSQCCVSPDYGCRGAFKRGSRQKAPVFSKDRYSALACLDASDQTSVAGTRKCTDGFRLCKNCWKLEEEIRASFCTVTICGAWAVPQCQPKRSALGSKQSGYVARKITRNVTEDLKKKKYPTRTGGTLGTYMKIFEKEDFRLPLKADGFRACRGNRHTHASTDVWQKENLEYDTPQSLLFLCLFCVSMYKFFLNHLFFNCLFWGVQFLLHTQKLTLFRPHTAAAENKGSMLHQTNRWARRQFSCWLHVGCGTAASYSSSIRSKFGILALFVTFTRIVYLS